MISLLDATTDPNLFARWFRKRETWSSWFAFLAALFGEPPLELAIGLETALDHATGHAAEPELVSRPVQRTLGLLTACVAGGAALGGIVALVFALAHQRVRKAASVTSV